MFTYENREGNATFANENLIYSTNSWDGKIFVKDIDNDTLNDIVAYENGVDGAAASIIYFKNNKGSNFGTPTTLYQFDFLLSQVTTITNFQFIDIHNDGLDDITFTTFRELGEGYPEDSRYWLQNIDNQGNYAEIAQISYRVDNFVFGDIDNDTDQDVIGFDFFENEIKWYQNTNGEGDFSFNAIVTNEVQNISSTLLNDINNDDYLDLVTSSIGDDKIAWYPNNFLNVSQFQIPTIDVYPNPTKGIVHISIDITLTNLTIYNLQGQAIAFFQSFETVDLSKLASGIYYVAITTHSGQTFTEKIIKQ